MHVAGGPFSKFFIDAIDHDDHVPCMCHVMCHVMCHHRVFSLVFHARNSFAVLGTGAHI